MKTLDKLYKNNTVSVIRKKLFITHSINLVIKFLSDNLAS